MFDYVFTVLRIKNIELQRLIKRWFEVTSTLFIPIVFTIFLFIGVGFGVAWFQIACLLTLLGILLYTFESLKYEDKQKSDKKILND